MWSVAEGEGDGEGEVAHECLAGGVPALGQHGDIADAPIRQRQHARVVRHTVQVGGLVGEGNVARQPRRAIGDERLIRKETP